MSRPRSGPSTRAGSRRPAITAHPRPRAQPPAPASEAVIFSGSLGGGHRSLAAACSAALGQMGMASTTLDVIDLLGARSGTVAQRIFRRGIEHGPAYDAFHFDQLRSGGRLARASERLAINRASVAVAGALPSAGPTDLALSVFATGAGVAARLRSAGRCRSSVVVVSDACAHRLWVHQETDLFLVGSKLAAASVHRYRPEAPVRVIDLPVGDKFLHTPSRADARARLGIPDSASCLLVMCGAWAAGPVGLIATTLAEAGHHVLAVAGEDRALLRRLQDAHVRLPDLHPFGYTSQVPMLMAAADLVVTSPGATCREARAVGRGLLLLDAVPGHGRENLQHELELGGAAVSEPSPDVIIRAVSASLEDPALADPAPAPGGGAASFIAALASIGLAQAPPVCHATGRAPATSDQAADTAAGRPVTRQTPTLSGLRPLAAVTPPPRR